MQASACAPTPRRVTGRAVAFARVRTVAVPATRYVPRVADRERESRPPSPAPGASRDARPGHRDRHAHRSFPVTPESEVSRHYTRGDLLARLEARLREDGCDPARPTFDALAPYDHFHGRGLEATEETADLLEASATDHVLDVGSGIGGPARYVARRFGCRVSGIDLTAEFCEVARHLTSLLGLEGRVSVRQGDALSMPFADAAFDGAYSMNVSMNIADKCALYRQIHRVLKPGARLVLSEVVQGPGGAPTTRRRGRGPRRPAFSRLRPRPERTSRRRGSQSRAFVTRPRPRSSTAPARGQWWQPVASRRTGPWP